MMAGADVNILDANNEGPLHLAIKGGHAGLTEDLLLRGADPELQVSFGYPIHLATELSQDEIVRNLLHTGAQIDRLSVHGMTALNLAVWHDHLSTVKVLLDQGADATIICRRESALNLAARRNNVDILAALVKAGADIEARTDRGLTPLHWAVFNSSRTATMRALLQLGANVHATSNLGSTPLHIACQGGKLDAADLLLRWGADETALNKNGRTPSDCIPDIAEAAEEDRPRLERLSRLLASAPQDRAWRRRGMMVLCRAHPEKLRLAVEIPDTAEAIGQPQGRPSRRARRSQVKVEVTMGGVRGGGAGGAGSSAGGGRRAAREGSGGGGCRGFDGVAAWLIALEEEYVFRNIVGFL